MHCVSASEHHLCHNMLTAQFVLSHGVYPFTTPFGKAKLALEEMNAYDSLHKKQNVINLR